MKTTLSKISGILFLFSTILLISTCSQKADVQADIDAINELYKELLAAIDAGDADRIVACYTDDGVEMPPGKARIGKEAVRTRMQSVFKEWSGECATYSVEEIIVDNEYAFMRNKTRIQWTPLNEGEASLGNAKTLLVLQRQPDGSWKIARFMFNTNEEE